MPAKSIRAQSRPPLVSAAILAVCSSAAAHFACTLRYPAAMLERRIAADPPSEARLAELVKIWEECTRLEVGFWDGSMNLEFEDL